jgi:hypothetical protein
MKKILTFCFLLFVSSLLLGSSFAMDRKKDFWAPLLKEGTEQFKGEKMISLKNWAGELAIDDTKSLTENIRNLFYPDVGNNDNILRKTLRTIMVGILVLFFVMAGYRFVMDADDEAAVKKNQMNFLYLIAGAAIIFTSIWVLWEALNLNNVEWITSSWGVSKWVSLLDRTENNIFVVVLGFLKGFAFFLAIIMMFYYGYQMMSAFDKEDKIKAARTGILNVILALIFIKTIDFLYFIAQQKDFTTQANDLVLVVAKFLGYIFGILIVLVIIYIAFQFVTGGEEWFKKGLTWLKNILIIGLVIFLFLLVIYQVFKDVVA